MQITLSCHLHCWVSKGPKVLQKARASKIARKRGVEVTGARQCVCSSDDTADAGKKVTVFIYNDSQ